MVKVGKKNQKKEGQRSATKKRLSVIQCQLRQGQELDEETQPILWIERPTDALAGAGSIWPKVGNPELLNAHQQACPSSNPLVLSMKGICVCLTHGLVPLAYIYSFSLIQSKLYFDKNCQKQLFKKSLLDIPENFATFMNLCFQFFLLFQYFTFFLLIY